MKGEEKAKPLGYAPALVIQFIGDKRAMMPVIDGEMVGEESWKKLRNAVERFYDKARKLETDQGV